MTRKKTLVMAMASGAVAVAAIVTLVLATHTRDSELSAEDIVILPLIVLALVVLTTIAITGIIACCYLAKRLGYDQTAGLLLLIPVVNVVVFFLWAFRPSPNEQALLRLRQEQRSHGSDERSLY